MYNNRLCIHMHFMYNSAGVGNLQSVLQLLGLQFWSAPAVLSTFGGPNVPLPSPCQRQDAHPHKELSESNPAPKSSSSYNQHFNNELSKGQKARDQNFLKQKYRLSLGNRTCWLRNFPSSIWLYANFVLVQPFALFQLSIACICILLLLICELPSGEWLTGWYIPPPNKNMLPWVRWREGYKHKTEVLYALPGSKAYWMKNSNFRTQQLPRCLCKAPAGWDHNSTLPLVNANNQYSEAPIQEVTHSHDYAAIDSFTVHNFV